MPPHAHSGQIARRSAVKSARRERIAYQIWAWCRDNGWYHTSAHIADAIGESRADVGYVIRDKGWTGRIDRSDARSRPDFPQHIQRLGGLNSIQASDIA